MNNELSVLCIMWVSMWVSVSLAVSVGIYLTRNPWCLLVFLIPAVVKFKYQTPEVQKDSAIEQEEAK